MRRLFWTPWTAALCAGALACGGSKNDTDGTGTDATTDVSTTQTPPVTTGEPETTTGGTTTTTATTAEPMTTAAETTAGTTAEPTSSGGMTTMGGTPMPVACGGKIYQCGDAMDNDGDGAIDGGDQECTSPCDDSEGSLQTDLPGQNLDCKNDCYWDDDSGVGNDKCEYDLQCDANNPGAMIGCEFKEACEPVVPDQCLQVCQALVPNGCDCFGCCHVETDSGTVDIFLGSNPECSLANIEACGTCTFQDTCNNKCEPEKCELCFGQEELPDECDMPTCDAEKQPCTVDKDGVSNCPEGFFCSTGCCQAIVPG